MSLSLGTFFDRWSRVLIAGAVAYAVALAVIVLSGWGGEGVAAWISAWGNFPLMALMLTMAWPVIRDPAVQEAALVSVRAFALAELPGATCVGDMESPIKGADGNREFLLCLRK